MQSDKYVVPEHYKDLDKYAWHIPAVGPATTYIKGIKILLYERIIYLYACNTPSTIYLGYTNSTAQGSA